MCVDRRYCTGKEGNFDGEASNVRCDWSIYAETSLNLPQIYSISRSFHIVRLDIGSDKGLECQIKANASVRMHGSGPPI